MTDLVRLIIENHTGSITIVSLFLAAAFGLALKKRIQEDFKSIQVDLRDLTRGFESLKLGIAKMEHSIELVSLSGRNLESRFSDLPHIREDIRTMEKRLSKVEQRRFQA